MVLFIDFPHLWFVCPTPSTAPSGVHTDCPGAGAALCPPCQSDLPGRRMTSIHMY